MISGEIPYIIYPRRSIFPTFVRLATGNLNSPDSTVNHPHQVTEANGVFFFARKFNNSLGIRGVIILPRYFNQL